MTCESFRKEMALLLYGELPFQQEERLEQHMDACEACRNAYTQQRTFHCLLDTSEAAVPDGLLGQCRRDLRIRLRDDLESPQEPANWWQRLFGAFVPGKVLRPAGALALVATGFFGARFVPVDFMPGQAGLAMAEPISSRVRFVNNDTEGKVQIIVDEVRQRTLSGRVEDEGIQQLLLAAARNSSDPGVRVDTVEILKNRTELVEVRGALLYALQHDANAGVRLKALEGLKPYAADPDTRKVLSRVLLTDENPGVRTQAIDLLVQTKGKDLVGTLQELMRKEDNSYVRFRCQRVLKEMNASVETF